MKTQTSYDAAMAECAKTGLALVDDDSEPGMVVDQPIEREAAGSLAALFREMGYEVSTTPDDEDRTKEWVYVRARDMGSLITAAERTASAAADRDTAVSEENQAAADLLTQVIDIVRPCLRAIGDSHPLDENHRFVRLSDGYGKHRLYVREDGALCEYALVRGGHGDAIVSETLTPYPDVLAAVVDGWDARYTDSVINMIAHRLDQAAPGLKSRAEKARKNAARLRAVAELLKK